MTTVTDKVEAGAAGLIECPGPGIYENVPAEVYRSWDAASNSSLWRMWTHSPAAARDDMLNGSEDSDCKARGTGIHAALLEPERFAAEYAIGPDVKLNTKAGKEAWEAFGAANPGRILIRGADGAAILAMRDAVWSHRAARNLLTRRSGTEVSVVWDDPDTGVRCKARWDLPCNGILVLGDLKSTRSAHWRKFRRSIRDYGYFQQGAFYLDGAAAHGILYEQFAIVAVEPTRPHGVAVYELAQEDLTAGRDRFKGLLRRWRKCAEANVWPGHPDAPTVLRMAPEYDVIGGEEDDDGN